MRVLLLACAFLLVGGAAHASPHRGARVLWARGAGAEGCVGARGIEEDVKARLGYDPFVLSPELEIEGAVTRTRTGFRADLAIRDASGKALGGRKLESRSEDGNCRSLGEAVAVAITVAVDPDAPAMAPPMTEERPPEEAPPPPPPPIPPEHRMGHATIAAGASAGLVPGISGVVSLLVGFPISDYVDLTVGARVWPESRKGDFGFGIASAEAGACVLPWARGPLRFCGGALFGLYDVYVHSVDLAPVDVGAFAWAAVDAGAMATVPLGKRFRVELGASAIMPLVRRSAFVRGQNDPVWEQNALGGLLEIGLGAGF